MITEQDNLLEQWRKQEQIPFVGWDFSFLGNQYISEQPPWSYQEIVSNAMKQVDSFLDLGTGGGEILLSFKDNFPSKVAATEGYLPNYELAKKRLSPYGVEIKSSIASLTNKLPFENSEFELIISRHTAFNPDEIIRVLNNSGTFISQQVDGTSHSDLMNIFGKKPQWPFFNADYAKNILTQSGFKIKEIREFTGKTIFKSIEAIILYLKAIPWYVEDFTVERYFNELYELNNCLRENGKLIFTEKLMLLQANKMG